MTAYPISAEFQVPVTHAIKFMVERGFVHIVVSDGTTPKGILTEREILKAISKSRNLNELTIEDVGWQPFIKLELGETVLDTAHLMTQNKSRLLVFDVDKLVGLSVPDLLRAFRKISTDVSLDRVISTNIEKCSRPNSVFDAAKIIHEKRIGSVIVHDVREYGIFSERDLLMCLYSSGFKADYEIRKYPSSPLIVSDKEIKIHQAANIMTANNIKRLGITQDGYLMGIVTARDLLDAYHGVIQANPAE
ncbi:MAG: CBS domain-containing protein [Nitrosopumilus sp.]